MRPTGHEIETFDINDRSLGRKIGPYILVSVWTPNNDK